MTTAAHAVSVPHPKPTDPFPGVTNGKFAMWLFLASDAMSFIGLLVAYAAIRWTYPAEMTYPDRMGWDPAKWFEMFGIQLTALNTFILICSSVTMVKALSGFKHGNLARGRLFLFLTAVGGTMFLSIQAIEWTHMIMHPDKKFGALVPGMEAMVYTKRATFNQQAATFYSLTGFHGCHVLGGVILLLTTLIKGKLGNKAWLEPNTIEIVGLYWHFVDLVWILIFTFVYLI